jgi:hypothetical protein
MGENLWIALGRFRPKASWWCTAHELKTARPAHSTGTAWVRPRAVTAHQGRTGSRPGKVVAAGAHRGGVTVVRQQNSLVWQCSCGDDGSWWRGVERWPARVWGGQGEGAWATWWGRGAHRAAARWRWRVAAVMRPLPMSSDTGVDTRMPRSSRAANGRRGVEEMGRRAWSRRGGKPGWGGAGGLNRRGQDGGGVRLVEGRHGARAPCGTRRPVVGSGTASGAAMTSTWCLCDARLEQGRRRLLSGPAWTDNASFDF